MPGPDVEYLYEDPGEELHQELDSGKAFRKKMVEDTSVPSLSGVYTGPGAGSDGKARGIGGSVVKAREQAPRPMNHDELMNMANELIADYSARTPHEEYQSYMEPALSAQDRYVPDYYVPPEYKGPPDWLTHYMENQPTTGTIVVDQMGNQRYMNERQRLRALKRAQEK